MKFDFFVWASLAVGFPAHAAPPSLDAQLLGAARKGDTQTAQSLIQRGAKVNARGADGQTALMFAVQGSSEPVVRLLLARGADVKARDKWGFTALGYGPMFAEEFVARGAEATPNDGAALSDWLENEIWVDSDIEDEQVKTDTQVFLRVGTNLNTRGFDEIGTTPLLNAVSSRPSLVAFLLDLGADANLADKAGQTPLLAAFGSLFEGQNDDTRALLLLRHGAKVNTRGEFDETALLLAAKANRLALARELIRRGADVNAPDKRGLSPLMRASDGGFPDMARLLLASGARTDARDKEGKTAMDYARSREFVVQGFFMGSPPPQAAKSGEERQRQEIERALRGRMEVQAILEKANRG